MDAWLAFFRHCCGRYPVVFVVIGTASEIDPRLRELGNVVVAKDFHTGLDQDLALIQTSAIHMGASSGPGFMAFFRRRPFLLVRHTLAAEAYRGLVVDGAWARFAWSTPYQRFYAGEETLDLLAGEFQRMWETVDAASWAELECDDDEGATGSWLR